MQEILASLCACSPDLAGILLQGPAPLPTAAPTSAYLAATLCPVRPTGAWLSLRLTNTILGFLIMMKV